MVGRGSRRYAARNEVVKTYTSIRGGAKGFVGDARRLYRVRKTNIGYDVRTTLEQTELVAAAYNASGSTVAPKLAGKDVLVLGAGQTAREWLPSAS
jgi:hypothetical protein